jgi:folate-dependent phosphoribosylglycinamide formyltransferase PurN
MNSEVPSPPPLRVGLLIDSFSQPAWVSKVVQDLQASAFAEISLVIKNDTPSEPQSRIRSSWQNRKYLLYALYNRVDNRIVSVEDDAFLRSDIREHVSNAPVVTVHPIMKKHSDWFSEQDVRAIAAYDLDVAITFGFRILRGEILKIFKHGVWSYHHGDNLVNRGGPAGFWEVMEGVPTTGAVLQVLTEDLDNGKVICRAWSPTVDKFSVKANRNHIYWRASDFVIRKLKQVYEEGAVKANENVYRPYSDKLYRMPTNAELFPRLSRLVWSYIKGKMRQQFYSEQWVLAYRFRSTVDDDNNAFFRFKYLMPPANCYWADPFPIKVNDKYYLFFEEFINRENKGRISVLELSKSGVSNPAVALERDYHLSYPFVFNWENRVMMIPESGANKRIELYVSTEFPHEWKLESILMEDVSAKDTTLVQFQGAWWMFVAIPTQPFADELHIFHADTPYGPWRPHKMNPVKSDVRSSRPAGKLFIWNGDLYRPSQDCSQCYGYAITLNRIMRLTPNEFVEEEVSKVLPRWRKEVLATHTLNTCDELTVIDCLIRKRRRTLA